jgi:co-chaperonin GroES (HSP10)
MKAANKWVWVIRDKADSEKSGIIIPRSGVEKPPTGEVISIGSLVQDKEIKSSKGKKAIWHKTVGQEITYKGVTYLILQEHEIIGID